MVGTIRSIMVLSGVAEKSGFPISGKRLDEHTESDTGVTGIAGSAGRAGGNGFPGDDSGSFEVVAVSG